MVAVVDVIADDPLESLVEMRLFHFFDFEFDAGEELRLLDVGVDLQVDLLDDVHSEQQHGLDVLVIIHAQDILGIEVYALDDLKVPSQNVELPPFEQNEVDVVLLDVERVDGLLDIQEFC